MVRIALPVAAALCATLVTAQQQYLDDYEFLCRTVADNSAALRRQKLDWKRVCAELQPRFARATNDAEHVANVMRMLAVLGDSHTGLWQTNVAGTRPSKWDGLYGGGLWFGWDHGRFMLRGVMDGHALQSQLPLGAALVAIDDEPTWLSMLREKRRITLYQGSSSDHSLFSSMSNRLLPFGARQEIGLTLLTHDGEIEKVVVRRWGPGGKAFYPSTVQVPDGLEHGEGAIATMLKTPWCDEVGYLRITGSMDAATVTAFHTAFDSLRGMRALLLDCRGMGGGGDGSAWAIAGRLFAKAVSNGRHGKIEPTGSWQFDGPVVMLQDETEVSSAETFTWAVSETERVVSVGRRTGGWGIIPRRFTLPSGLGEIRLGVNDRPTPIQGVHTEGEGWPPDIEVPYGPVFCTIPDPDREVGMEILQVLHAGVSRDKVVDLFGGLFDGDVAAYRKAAERLRKQVDGWRPDGLAKRFADDLEATLRLEIAMLTEAKLDAPDVAGSALRYERLEQAGKRAKLAALVTRWKKALASAKAEAAAQREFVERVDGEFRMSESARKAWQKKHRKTATAKVVAERVFSQGE